MQTENYMFLCKINVKCRIFKKFRLFNSHKQVWKISNLKIKWDWGFIAVYFDSLEPLKCLIPPKRAWGWFSPSDVCLSLSKGWGRGGDCGVRASFWATGQPDGTWQTPLKAEWMVLVGTETLQVVPVEAGGQAEDLGGDEEKQACSHWTLSGFLVKTKLFSLLLISVHFYQAHLGP